MTARLFVDLMLHYKQATQAPTYDDADPKLAEAVNAVLTKPKHIEMMLTIARDSLPLGYLNASLNDISERCEVKLGTSGRIMTILREKDLIWRFKTDIKKTRLAHRNIYVINWQKLNYVQEKLCGARSLSKIPFRVESDREIAIKLFRKQASWVRKSLSALHP